VFIHISLLVQTKLSLDKTNKSWFVDFNIKQTSFFIRKLNGFKNLLKLAYNIETSNNHKHCLAIPEIESFIEKTGVKINYHKEPRFFITGVPKFCGILNSKVKSWDCQIYLPYPSMYMGDRNQYFYYYTLFHELTHWSGSEKNLQRFKSTGEIAESRKTYAFEELIAAFGSALLMEKFGMYDKDIKDRTVAYIADYAMILLYACLEDKTMPYDEAWTVDDYMKNDPTINEYLVLADKEARRAVTFLENM
jgi:antirestriction protein ArdC